MPREKLARSRIDGKGLIARSFHVALLCALGGVINGLILAIAAVFGEEIRLIAADDTLSSFPSAAVQASTFGAMLGGVTGAILCPIAITTLVRTDYVWSLTTVFLVSTLTACSAVIHPAIGLLGSLAGFLIACVVVSLRSTQVWSPPIPPGACVRCGYDLCGLEADVCPECGKQRPSPRQCRVCLHPFSRVEFLRPSIFPMPIICDSCRQHIGPDLTCQRCGHRLPPDAATCPGCHRPTGLPAKS